VGWQTKLQWILNAGNMILVINLFNLLPILPLDGGKMLKSLFFEKNQIINMVFMVISILFLILYAIAAKIFILLLIPFALVWSLVNQVKIKKLRKELIQLGFNIERNYDELDSKSFWLIREKIGQNFKAYAKSILPGQYVPSVDELRNINMVKAILMNHPEADLKWSGKIIFGSIVIFNLLLLLAWGFIYLVMLKVIG
jgi:stage IV sporulation protein FB